MKKVLYIGHVGGQSYGDEVALDLLQNYVQENYKHKIKLVVHNAVISKFMQYGSMSYDFFLIGGGTCISNLCRPFADRILVNLRDNKKRYGILGAGVFFEKRRDQGKFTCVASDKTKRETKLFIEGADFIAIRDEASKNHMKQLAPGADIRVLYDPGLAIEYKKKNIDFSKQTIGINLAKENMRCLGTIKIDRNILYKKVYEFIKSKSGEYNFTFIPFNKADELFFSKMKKLGVHCCKYGKPSHIANATQNCDYFIGVRVHSDITCAAYGIPFISITYTLPNLNFLSHINYDHYIMSDELCYTDVSLLDKFESLISQQENIKQHLINEASKARESYRENVERLCQIILKS